METSSSGGRWLVSGVLGLAVLGTAGCATTATPASRDAGPAVVLNVPAEPTPSASASPTAKPSPVKAKATASADGTAKKVPAPSPESANEGPDSPPSARTP